MVCSYALGILNIKLNAWITGTCLLLEVAALLVIVFLGFGHPVQPVSVLFQPQIVENGMLHLAPWALVIGAVGIGLFSFNGYGPAVLLAEDMKCGGKGVHKAVLWSLGLVVVIELVPITALLIGAPSLSAMISSPDPIGYLLTSHGNETLSRLVSAGSPLGIQRHRRHRDPDRPRGIQQRPRRPVDADHQQTVHAHSPALGFALAGDAVPGDPFGAAEFQLQPGGPHLVQCAADHAGVPDRGLECADEPGAAA